MPHKLVDLSSAPCAAPSASSAPRAIVAVFLPRSFGPVDAPAWLESRPFFVLPASSAPRSQLWQRLPETPLPRWSADVGLALAATFAERVRGAAGGVAFFADESGTLCGFHSSHGLAEVVRSFAADGFHVVDVGQLLDGTFGVAPAGAAPAGVTPLEDDDAPAAMRAWRRFVTGADGWGELAPVEPVVVTEGPCSPLSAAFIDTFPTLAALLRASTSIVVADRDQRLRFHCFQRGARTAGWLCTLPATEPEPLPLTEDHALLLRELGAVQDFAGSEPRVWRDLLRGWPYGVLCDVEAGLSAWDDWLAAEAGPEAPPVLAAADCYVVGRYANGDAMIVHRPTRRVLFIGHDGAPCEALRPLAGAPDDTLFTLPGGETIAGLIETLARETAAELAR